MGRRLKIKKSDGTFEDLGLFMVDSDLSTININLMGSVGYSTQSSAASNYMWKCRVSLYAWLYSYDPAVFTSYLGLPQYAVRTSDPNVYAWRIPLGTETSGGNQLRQYFSIQKMTQYKCSGSQYNTTTVEYNSNTMALVTGSNTTTAVKGVS